MKDNSSTFLCRAKLVLSNLGPNRRVFVVLGGVSILAIIYIGVNTFLSTRLEVALADLERAHLLNHQLSLSKPLLPTSKLIGELLGQDIRKDHTLAGIKLVERSQYCSDANSQLSGPVEPLLRWLASLEARGISLVYLRWSMSVEGKLDVCL